MSKLLRKSLSIMLCLAMILSVANITFVSAVNEVTLFEDDFEGYKTTELTERWDAAWGPVIAEDPYEANNHVMEMAGTLSQKWPAAHKTVDMPVGTTTVFEGRVKIVPSATCTQNYYLELRRSANDTSATRQQIFNIGPEKITLLNSGNYGKITAGEWVSYKMYITPGAQGEATDFMLVLNADNLYDAEGNKTTTLTISETKTIDSVGIYETGKGKMVHNNNFPVATDDDAARTYLDDVVIYSTEAVSKNADLATLTYDIDGTSYEISDFAAASKDYKVLLPMGTTKVSLNATTADADAKISYSADSLSVFPGTLSATVTAPAGNTKTYTVTFALKTSEAEMAAEILETENGAKAVLAMTFDDGLPNTALFLAEMFEKYDLYGTCMVIAQNINNSTTYEKFKTAVAGGRIEIGSHSMTHAILNDTTAPDSTYVYELDDATALLQSKFPGQEVITYAPSNNTCTPAGMVHVKNMHYAVRMGSRGYNSLSPDEDRWYNLLMQGIGDVSTVSARNAWVDNAIKNNQFLVQMWHGIEEGGYQTQNKTDSEAHFKYIAEKQNAGELWVQSLGTVTKYLRERQKSTVTASMVGDWVQVDLEYPEGALKADVFDYPLTVKVEVPDDWGMVNVSQGGNETIVSSKGVPGDRYVWASIVPNGGTATLSEAGTSNKLSAIKLNNVPIDSFVANTFEYDVEFASDDLPISIEALPLDGTAEIAYSPSAVVAELPATHTITVKDIDGGVSTYTLNFIYAKSTNTNLTQISVGSTPIANYASNLKDYTVFVPFGANSVEVLATTEHPNATVTYSPSNTVTEFPATVKIKVTAENGTATDEYKVTVVSKASNYYYIDEDYENTTAGTTSGSTWNAISGAQFCEDPTDPDNMVAKYPGNASGTQYLQLNQNIGMTTEPLVLAGRVMFDPADTGSAYDMSVRGEGTNLVGVLNMAGDRNIKIGSTTIGKYSVGKWYDYTVVITPDQTAKKYKVTAYLTGEGLAKADGTPVTSLSGSGVSGSYTNGDYTTMNCRILKRGVTATGTNNVVYIDDSKIYNPGEFILSADTSDYIDLSMGIDVTTSTSFDASALTANDVVLKDASGAPMNVTLDKVTSNSFRVLSSADVEEGICTLTLKDTFLDIIGQSAANTITFNALGSSYDDITAIAINAPANTSQKYGSTEKVSFSVTPVPSTNINPNKVEWYLNDVAVKNGLEYELTPVNAGTYKVYAKVYNTNITTDAVTVTVDKLDPVVTWPSVKAIKPGKTFINAVDNDGIGDGEFSIEDANIIAKEEDNGAKKYLIFTPADTVNYNTLRSPNPVTVVVSAAASAAEDDVVLLDDSFDEYGNVGTYVTTDNSKYASVSHNASNGLGLVVTADPTDDSNLAVKWTAGTANVGGADQTLKFSFDTSKPYIVSGRILKENGANGTSYIKANNSQQVVYFMSNAHDSNPQRITHYKYWFSEGTANPFVAKGQWVEYTVAVNPDAGTISYSFSGAVGASPANANNGTYRTFYNEYGSSEVDIKTKMVNSMSWIYQLNSANTGSMYMDDLKVVTSSSFIIEPEKAKEVSGKVLTLKLNHPMKASTFTASAITVNEYNPTTGELGATVAVSDAKAETNSTTATITFTNDLSADKAYMISFADSVVDVLGYTVADNITINADVTTEPEIIVGDIDGDGSVTPIDRAILVRALAHWKTYTYDVATADLNLDGVVNSVDRAIFGRYLARWDGYDSLPYTK